MNRLATRVLSLVAASVLSAVAFAGSAGAVTFYINNNANWSSAVSGAITDESFSTNMANAPTLAINADLTSTVVGGLGTNGIHRVTGGELDLWFGDDGNRYDSFTWTFASPISGLQVLLSGFAPVFSVSFDEGDGIETHNVLSLLGSGSGLFGMVFDQGITSLTFTTTDDFDNGTMDNLSYASAAAIPIPAALPLLASGLGALGFFGWRRKRSAGA